MLPDAGANIIITHGHDADHQLLFTLKVGRQPAEIDQLARLFAGQHLRFHRQMTCEDLIDPPLQLGGLGILQRTGEMIIAFGLVRIQMRTERTPAPEHAHHRLVQHMLRRMHKRIVFLAHRNSFSSKVLETVPPYPIPPPETIRTRTRPPSLEIPQCSPYAGTPNIRMIMQKKDLFPEDGIPACELREPERPIDAPYAVDIPAVPTALGALDAASRAEFWAALALSHTDGLGARSRKRLLDAFGSAFEAVRRVGDWREAGLREDLIREFRSEKWREPARKEWDATRKLAGTVLLWTDARYPALLRELPDAPIRLYCQGDMSLLGNPCVSIVGTRTCSREGIRAAQAVASGLAASGVTVVSGLAVGIDKQAHLAALDLPGGTIAVLGAGPDVCYPKENDELRQSIIQRGLLVSEYAPGTLPDPRHFPIRNRIISGLSLGVVVVEAALRSGSLITARLALEQNRTVYAVPGGIGSKYAEGCQKLIRDGAQPIFSFSDILSDLSAQLKTRLPQPDPAPRPYSVADPLDFPLPAPAAPPPLRQPDRSTLEGRILTLLAQTPRAIDDVCQALGCDPGEAGSTLIILEVRGLIRQRPDLRYALT